MQVLSYLTNGGFTKAGMLVKYSGLAVKPQVIRAILRGVWWRL